MKVIAYIDKDGNGYSGTDPWIYFVPAGSDPKAEANRLFDEEKCQKVVLFDYFPNNEINLTIPWDEINKHILLTLGQDA